MGTKFSLKSSKKFSLASLTNFTRFIQDIARPGSDIFRGPFTFGVEKKLLLEGDTLRHKIILNFGD